MKKRCIYGLFAFCLIIFLSACSSNNTEEAKSANDMVKMDEASDSGELAVLDQDVQPAVEKAEKEPYETSDRMIIHRANLEVNVKNLEKAQQTLEKQVKGYGGYIVESNIYREDEEFMSGHLTIRIPEKHFQQLLHDVEEAAEKVLGRNISGQDVTEEYIDLESRLKSKRAVEERLLDFMKEAQKTEDLLKISNDLAKVQEEIEVIVGKMKYLENQTDYSTVEVYMHETKVVVPGVDGKDLNTWEKTKKQLAVSLNFLLATASGLVVFFVGNLPVILIFVLIAAGIYFLIKRKRRKLKE